MAWSRLAAISSSQFSPAGCGRRADPERVLVGQVHERARMKRRVVAKLVDRPHPCRRDRVGLTLVAHAPVLEEQVGLDGSELVGRRTAGAENRCTSAPASST